MRTTSRGGRATGRFLIVATLAVTIALALGTVSSAYPRPGSTRMVSVASDGTIAFTPPEQIGSGLNGVDLSADGRSVVFASAATNLVPGDINQASDAFIHDMETGRTERVSVSSTGGQGLGDCESGIKGAMWPTVSADGRYVAFASCFTNLVPGDTNNTRDIFVHDRKTKTTRLATVPFVSDGAQDDVMEPAISANGRVVAFRSGSESYVRGDTNGIEDVFVRDMKAGVTERVSVTTGGVQGEKEQPELFIQGANCPSLSATGRYVAFTSSSPLVEGDANGARDIFVHDRKSGKTERISVASDGAEARGLVSATRDQSGGCWSGDSGRRAISADGRYVAYHSSATNLIPSDVNRTQDVFVYDRATKRTERISVDEAGGEATKGSFLSAISANGRYVVFESMNPFYSGDQIDGDLPAPDIPLLGGDADIFIYDRQTGSLEWLSVAPDGSKLHPCLVDEQTLQSLVEERVTSVWTSRQPSVSADGRYVAFKSCADNVVPGDLNLAADAFVRDRGTRLGVGGTGDAGPSGGDGVPEEICVADLCLPPLGTVSTLAKDHPTDGLLKGTRLYGASLANRPAYSDLFVRLMVADMPSLGAGAVSATPYQGILYGLRFRAQGVSYEVRVQTNVTDSAGSIGAASFGLFRCAEDSVCTRVGTLKGGYGTTGEEVVFSLPLAKIGLLSGGKLTRVEAFSALGTLETGAVEVIDRVHLPGGR